MNCYYHSYPTKVEADKRLAMIIRRNRKEKRVRRLFTVAYCDQCQAWHLFPSEAQEPA